MTIRSAIKPFSLPELFQEIEAEQKSGRLIVKIVSPIETSPLKGIYFLWFHEGCLVAISDRINYKGLIELLETHHWLSPLITKKLRTLCPPEMPLGVYLHQNKLLTREILTLIFQLRLHQVYQLFQLESGQFQFDELSELQDRLFTIPWLEMTGHRMRATQVSMYALRLIKNWARFQDYFPEPNSGVRALAAKPHIKLLALEKEVWHLADGATSLDAIAIKTQQLLKTIQIIALRLMLVGLLEETFIKNQSQNSLPETPLFPNPTTSNFTKNSDHLN
ncbi:MAG TPA: DUF4388 domain-containing protein [Xenococcaceae cyanobacterium]|jgi:hypothetical protein